jgi:hypothetical protein
VTLAASQADFGAEVGQMLEAIKLVGAIAGLLTTAFVIWDRWARGRPLAWVTAKKLGANPYEYIRIKNPGPADVFILAVRAYPSKIYAIAKDHSPGSVMRTQVNIDVNVLLPQGEIWDLPIVKLPKPVEEPKDQPNVAEAPQDQPVRFVIYWRKTSSSYLRQVPVVIMTSTHDIERIAKAATADFNAR